MSTFHRRSTPSYFGGLPGGYDYLNKPTDPSVGGTGAAAFADGKKVGGPNDGTYYIAFGEDATSLDANRPSDALGTNTDFLDDILHRDLSLTVRTADVTAGGAVASVVISGQVFVGAFGTPNNADQRGRLISALDSNDNEIIDSTGATVVASLIHNGSSTNVVGTQSSGFYSGPTVNFTPSIPSGTTYRIYYGQRTNLASLPISAFTDLIIRNAQEVDGVVESQFRNLHAPGNLQAWDAPWDSTIRALAASGLNERYRRKTGVPASFTFDTPGDGAIIVRDGKALEVRGFTNTLGTGAPPDKNLALIRLTGDSTTAVGGSWPLTNKGADVGIWHETDLNGSNTASEISRLGVSGPALMDVVPRNYTSGTLTTQAFTYVNPASTATLNPTSGSDSSSKRRVQCAAGQYFRIPSGGDANKTAVRVGLDMVEVTVGGVTSTYMITDFVGTNSVLVAHMTGKFADFGATAVSANIRLVQTAVSIGGSAGTLSQLPHLPVAIFAPPPPTQVGGDSPFNRIQPSVFAAPSNAQQEPPASSDADMTALHWGYYDINTGYFVGTGQLRGDGQVRTYRGAWTLSVGDGVNSFGDFNGPTAITDAMLHMDFLWGNHNWSARIYVRRGNYNINSGSDNPITVDSGQEIVLLGDGQGAGGTSIFNASSGTGSLMKIGNGRIIVQDMRLVSNNDGPIELGIDGSSSPQLELTRCTVFGPIKVSRAPLIINESNGNTLLARSCNFEAGAGGRSLIWISPTGGLIHLEGLTFEDCRFEAPANNALMRIDPIASQAVYIDDISFVRCAIKLNGQLTKLVNEIDPTVVTSDVVRNSGILHINGSSGVTAYAASQIKKIRFENCEVFATGDRPLLMFAQFSPRFRCLAFEIEGGRWVVDNTTTVIDSNPFSVVPMALTYDSGTPRGYDALAISPNGGEPIVNFSMKGVKIGYGTDGAASLTASPFGRNYGTPTTYQSVGSSVQWGCIVVRANVVEIEETEFLGSVRKSGLPELEVFGVDSTVVSKFKVANLGATAGTAIVFPNARVSVVVGGLTGSAVIEDVVLDGSNGTATTNSSPLLALCYSAVSSTSDLTLPGYLIHIDRCTIGKNTASGGYSIGYVGPASNSQYLRVIISNSTVYGNNTDGIVFAEPIPKLLHIKGNTITGHGQYGVDVAAHTWGLDRSIVIENNTITGCVGQGIICIATTAWELTGTLGLSTALVAGPDIRNNRVFNNDTGNVQITIGLTTINNPGGIIIGNDCLGQFIRVLTIATTGYIYTVGLQPIKSASIPNVYPWVEADGSAPANSEPMSMNRALWRKT
jgi:hypothetical protein